MSKAAWLNDHYTDDDLFHCETPDCPEYGDLVGFTPETVKFDASGDRPCCLSCGEELEEDYSDSGYDDYDERMSERRAMGLSGF